MMMGLNIELNWFVSKSIPLSISEKQLRRKLSAEQVSERANIGTSTLWRIEKGDPGVAMGNYFQVLISLGLDKEILKMALDDELGRKIQDAALTTNKRAPKRRDKS